MGAELSDSRCVYAQRWTRRVNGVTREVQPVELSKPVVLMGNRIRRTRLVENVSRQIDPERATEGKLANWAVLRSEHRHRDIRQPLIDDFVERALVVATALVQAA